MNAKESNKMLEEFRKSVEARIPNSGLTRGLSMFNDKYDTVVAVALAALASADEQEEESPDSD